MTRAEQIAKYLHEQITFPRVSPFGSPVSIHPQSYPVYQARPTVEDLASQFLRDSGYQALRLGTWLGTTDGEIIAAAVGLVVPPFFASDAQLIIDGLKLAAAIQQQNGKGTAGRVLASGLAFAAAVVAAQRWGRAA